MEKIKRKYEQIEEQQTQITAHLAQLEKFKTKKLEGDIDGLQQNSLKGSQSIRRNRSQIENQVSSLEHNFIASQC